MAKRLVIVALVFALLLLRYPAIAALRGWPAEDKMIVEAGHTRERKTIYVGDLYVFDPPSTKHILYRLHGKQGPQVPCGSEGATLLAKGVPFKWQADRVGMFDFAWKAIVTCPDNSPQCGCDQTQIALVVLDQAASLSGSSCSKSWLGCSLTWLRGQSASGRSSRILVGSAVAPQATSSPQYHTSMSPQTPSTLPHIPFRFHHHHHHHHHRHLHHHHNTPPSLSNGSTTSCAPPPPPPPHQIPPHPPSPSISTAPSPSLTAPPFHQASPPPLTTLSPPLSPSTASPPPHFGAPSPFGQTQPPMSPPQFSSPPSPPLALSPPMGSANGPTPFPLVPTPAIVLSPSSSPSLSVPTPATLSSPSSSPAAASPPTSSISPSPTINTPSL